MEGSKGWRHYRGTDRGNRARDAKRETEIPRSVAGREGRAVPSEGDREGETNRERQREKRYTEGAGRLHTMPPNRVQPSPCPLDEEPFPCQPFRLVCNRLVLGELTPLHFRRSPTHFPGGGCSQSAVEFPWPAAAG